MSQLKKYAIALCAVIVLAGALPAHAALTSTIRWNVRTDGNDSNGGCFDPSVASPGTDYGNQAAAQVTYTDLVIGATTTQLTSATTPFTSAHVGNCIHVTGGTGFTTGWYLCTSLTGAACVMDRSVGTAASTGGTGSLGGAFATPQQANTVLVSGNIVNVKNGTYTFTTGMQLQTSGSVSSDWIGYNTAYNDLITTQGSTNKPLFTTATNSTRIILLNGVRNTFTSIAFSNTAGTRSNAIYAGGGGAILGINNCYFTGFGGATDSGAALDGANNAGFGFNFLVVSNTEFTANTMAVINQSSVGGNFITGNYFHGDVSDLNLNSSGSSILQGNIFSSATSASVSPVVVNAGYIHQILNNTFYNNAFTALTITTSYYCVSGNIFYSNLRAIANSVTTAMCPNTQVTNAYGSNTNGNTGWTASSYDVTLSANPFTSAGTGDFSLNSTAGGGAALTALAWPRKFGTTTTQKLNYGAVESSGSGGGGTTVLVAPSAF